MRGGCVDAMVTPQGRCLILPIPSISQRLLPPAEIYRNANHERSAPVPAVTPRRFPPPWTAVEENAASFIVRDATGRSLAYIYFEGDRGVARRRD